jgi:hypothetical protein
LFCDDPEIPSGGYFGGCLTKPYILGQQAGEVRTDRRQVSVGEIGDDPLHRILGGCRRVGETPTSTIATTTPVTVAHESQEGLTSFYHNGQYVQYERDRPEPHSPHRGERA